MRINFFEEYPTAENLLKAKMVDFPSTIFLAAHSLQEFKEVREKLKAVNPLVEVAYWPILPKTYWLSPFMDTVDLVHFIDEMKNAGESITVLADLELPLAKLAYLYVKNCFAFSENKKLLQSFFANAPEWGIKIIAAEYPPPSDFWAKLFRKLGVSYDVNEYHHTSCVMYYTSMIPQAILPRTREMIQKLQKENGALELGLGTIATGMLENEPLLPAEELDRDLAFMKENNFTTATIFRLGGLTEEYYRVIRKYTN